MRRTLLNWDGAEWIKEGKRHFVGVKYDLDRCNLHEALRRGLWLPARRPDRRRIRAGRNEPCVGVPPADFAGRGLFCALRHGSSRSTFRAPDSGGGPRTAGWIPGAGRCARPAWPFPAPHLLGSGGQWARRPCSPKPCSPKPCSRKGVSWARAAVRRARRPLDWRIVQTCRAPGPGRVVRNGRFTAQAPLIDRSWRPIYPGGVLKQASCDHNDPLLPKNPCQRMGNNDCF